MSKRILCAALTLLLCVGVLAGCGQKGQENAASPGTGGTRPGGAAEATVMVYVVGSDLESSRGAASEDILEMVNSGMDFDNKNLLVMTGGAKTWNRSTGISSGQLEIYRLSRRGLLRVASFPQASMGAADTLCGFLDYCYANYPAESYGLIIWDHGGGPMQGCAVDEIYQDRLTLPELRLGLENSPFGQDNKLAFVGFDASFMASAETAWCLREYTDYLIASEEAVPAQGWDYRFLARLDPGPLDGAAVGRLVTESYAAWYQSSLSGESLLQRLCISCLDLRRAGDMEEALDELSVLLAEDLAAGHYPDLARLRSAALPVGRFTAATDYDLVDLWDLANELLERHPEEANALRLSVDDMVVCSWSSQQRCHGMTIYFPFDNQSAYTSDWGRAYQGLGFAPAYTSFLNKFCGDWLAVSGASWQEQGLARPMQDAESGRVYLQLSEEQAAEYLDGCYYVLRKTGDGRYNLCGQRQALSLEEDGRLFADFDGYAVYAFNSVGEVYPVLYRDYPETGIHDYHVAAALHTDPMGDGAFRLENVWFLVSLPHPGDSDALGAAIVRRNDDQLSFGKEELRISDYPCLYFPVFEAAEARDEEGRLLPVSRWETRTTEYFASLSTGRGWRAELRPLADDGYEYYIQIAVRDCRGREYGSELVPLRFPEQVQQTQDEMFQNRFYPLPARKDPPPELPPLRSLRYFTDAKWYSPALVKEQLVLDDPSGIRMTLLSGAYRMDAQEHPKDLVLIFRVDNQSPYFDELNLATDGNLRIPVGNKMVKVYFLPEITGVWQQQGGSYYYTMSIPLSELPRDADALTCVFRLSQKEWGSQLNLYYETDPVEIPLP